MTRVHDSLKQEDPADVAVETTSSTWYRFDKVAVPVLATALEKATADSTTFSLLNLDGVAMVIPWRIVRAVHAANTPEGVDLDDDELDDDRNWELLWEREAAVVTEPARVFNEQ